MRSNIALLVQVKNNQPTLHRIIPQIAATAEPLSSLHGHDKAPGRDESRTVTVFDPALPNSMIATGNPLSPPSSVSSVLSTPAVGGPGPVGARADFSRRYFSST